MHVDGAGVGHTACLFIEARIYASCTFLSVSFCPEPGSLHSSLNQVEGRTSCGSEGFMDTRPQFPEFLQYLDPLDDCLERD